MDYHQKLPIDWNGRTPSEDWIRYWCAHSNILFNRRSLQCQRQCNGEMSHRGNVLRIEEFTHTGFLITWQMAIDPKLIWNNWNKTLQDVLLVENNPLRGGGNGNSASSHQTVVDYFPPNRRTRKVVFPYIWYIGKHTWTIINKTIQYKTILY